MRPPPRLLVLLASLFVFVAPGRAADVAFIDALAGFQYGKDVKLEATALRFIGEHKNDPATLRQFSAAVRAAAARATTTDARALAAQLLGLAGGPDDVPFLAGLLKSPADFPAGVSALSQLGNDTAIDALAQALQETTDDTRRLALIKALGWSHAPRAADALARFAETATAELAVASYEALSASATPAAIAALGSATRPEAIRFQLIAARTLARQGQPKDAVQLLNKLLPSPALTGSLRIAAARTLLDYRLPGWERILQNLTKDPAPAARSLVLDYFAELPPGEQQKLIDALQAAPNAPETAQYLVRLQDSLPPGALIPFLSSTHAEIRQLAQRQIARRPDRASYERAISEYLQASDERASKTWLTILIAMPRPVDAWLAESIAAATTPANQIKLAQLIRRRTALAAAPGVLPLLRHGDAKVRQAAFEALGATGLNDASAVLELFTLAKLPAERREAANALRATFRRSADRANFVALTVAQLPSFPPATREALLGFLGETGDASALRALWKIYDEGDAAARAHVLRSLGRWPDATALDGLARAAGGEQAANLRILALRAYLEILGRNRTLPPGQLLTLIERGVQLAERDEERVAALALAAAVPDASASRIFDAFAAHPSLAKEVETARKAHTETLKGPQKATKAKAKPAADADDDN